MIRAQPPRQRSRWHSLSPQQAGGWSLIAGLLLVMTVCQGIISAGLPALDKAILADLQISRGALKLRETIFLLSSGTSGLLIGFLTIKVQPSRIVLAGLVLLSATLTLYGHASSIGQIYVLYIFLGFSFATSHVVIVVLMVRAWFETRRTLATSIALSGTSIGAAIFPSLAVLALEQWDWRTVVRWAALLPILLLPITALLVRSPARTVASSDLAPTLPPLPLAASSGRPRGALPLLMIATFGTFFASTAFILNLFLYLQDIGLGARSAALGLSVVFVTGLFAKILVGFAAEKWGTNRVWNTQQALLFIGALLLSAGNPTVAVVALVFLGAGWAGCYVLTQVVIANYFAGPRLAQLTGAFIVFEAIASGLGVWGAGALFDVLGSYRPGFYFCTALIAVSGIAGYLFRKLSNDA